MIYPYLIPSFLTEQLFLGNPRQICPAVRDFQRGTCKLSALEISNVTMQMLKLPDLLQELSLSLELGPISKANQKQTISFPLPGLTLEFREMPKGFSMWGPIGQVPQKNKEDFYLFLMRANFLGQGTNGYVLGMDQEEKHLTLSSYIPYELDFKQFKETVEDFINFLSYWQDELARHNEKAKAAFAS